MISLSRLKQLVYFITLTVLCQPLFSSFNFLFLTLLWQPSSAANVILSHLQKNVNNKLYKLYIQFIASLYNLNAPPVITDIYSQDIHCSYMIFADVIINLSLLWLPVISGGMLSYHTHKGMSTIIVLILYSICSITIQIISPLCDTAY